MADDPDDALRRRFRELREQLEAAIPDTPGHRERMARLRDERRILVAMIPTANLRRALDAACVGCGDPEHDPERVIRWTVNTVIREWTIFCMDLRSLARELREGAGDAPLPDDVRFALDETLFRPLDLPDRMSRVHLHHGGSVATWLDHCHVALIEHLDHLIHERAVAIAHELVDGFSAALRAAVDANGGTLRVHGHIIVKTDRGYEIGNDVPPPPPSAS
jgi:hypothetical protein